MKKILLFLLASFFIVKGQAQNLIPNPGFENYTTCPTGIYQFPLLTNWFEFPNHSGSADFFHVCGSGGAGIPFNTFGAEMAAEGSGYVGGYLFLTSFDYREYIEVQLISPLIAGQTYDLKLKISLADNCSIACNNFGAHFSDTLVNGNGGGGAQTALIPQVNSSTIISDTSGWTDLAFTFTATGGEQYMVLGNFKDDVSTSTLALTAGSIPGAYYYIDSMSLTVASTNLNITGDSSVCLGESTTLTATSGFSSYQWATSTNPTSIISTDSTVTVTPVVTTTYYVYTATDTASFVVTVNTPVSVNLGNDTTLCEGQNLLLTVLNPGASYLWNNGTTLSSLNVTSAGTYWVQVTLNGCISSDTININYYPMVFNVVTNPSNVCKGDTCIITVNGTGLSFNISNGIISGTPFVPATTNAYTVVATDANGCTKLSVTTVTVNNLPVVSLSPNNPLICKGDSVLLTASGASTYTWLPNTKLTPVTFNTVWSQPAAPLTYTVTGTDAQGCTGTASASIEMIYGIEVNVSKDHDVTCADNIVKLTASGADFYTWFPTANLSNPTSPVTDAYVADTTTYYVVGNTAGCRDTASIEILYYDNTGTMFIPTAFSPNEDGLNDCFRIKHNASFSRFYIAIYNRYGQRVFVLSCSCDYSSCMLCTACLTFSIDFTAF